jgi:hypothetical protein
MLFNIPTPKAWCGPRRGTRGPRRRTRRRPKQKELEALRSERGGALLSELAVKCGGGAGHQAPSSPRGQRRTSGSSPRRRWPSRSGATGVSGAHYADAGARARGGSWRLKPSRSRTVWHELKQVNSVELKTTPKVFHKNASCASRPALLCPSVASTRRTGTP